MQGKKKKPNLEELKRENKQTNMSRRAERRDERIPHPLNLLTGHRGSRGAPQEFQSPPSTQEPPALLQKLGSPCPGAAEAV